MSLRFASLGSGSAGNATLVVSENTTVLLDCGFTCKEVEKRLLGIGVEPTSVDALVVTHEHQDHMKGVSVFSRRYGVPVWLSYGTAQAHRGGEVFQPNIINSHQAFYIGDIGLQPFPVPHDAREPVQFVFTCQGKRLGIFTDAGHVTRHVVNRLSALDALVLEFNHESDLLREGRYSPSLKKRVGGNYGHLNNHQAANLAYTVYHPSMQHLIAAHLSAENNTVEHVEKACLDYFSHLPCGFDIGCQHRGYEWKTIT